MRISVYPPDIPQIHTRLYRAIKIDLNSMNSRNASCAASFTLVCLFLSDWTSRNQSRYFWWSEIKCRERSFQVFFDNDKWRFLLICNIYWNIEKNFVNTVALALKIVPSWELSRPSITLYPLWFQHYHPDEKFKVRAISDRPILTFCYVVPGRIAGWKSVTETVTVFKR